MTRPPLLTFALITYRQEAFAVQAARAALEQTYQPLEIILSDDCSPDGTFSLLRQTAAAYHGPHSVLTRQTEHNLGLIGHINDIMRLARGQLVVIAAGDDLSLPERTQRIYEAYQASGGRAYSLFSNALWMDERGNPLNLLRTEPVSPATLTLRAYAARRVPGLVTGATHAWRREIFDLFGPMPPEVRAEDILLPFRSALLGEICYIDEPLVLYRRDATRLRDAQGRNSFTQHRQRWLGWQHLHAATYRARLDDLHTCQQRGLSPHPPADLNFAGQVTATRLAELQELLDANQPTPAARPAWRRLKLRARGWLEPLFDFLRLNLYYRYQDLRRRRQTTPTQL